MTAKPETLQDYENKDRDTVVNTNLGKFELIRAEREKHKVFMDMVESVRRLEQRVAQLERDLAHVR